MKKSFLPKLFLFLLICAGAGGAYMYWRTHHTVESDYRHTPVTRGAIAISVLATGIVQPENRLEIKPGIPGRAEQVLVEEGDSVRQGQTLIWMSSTERAALLDAARARGPEELKKWEDLYRPAPILAPIKGTIILKAIEPGQTFAATDAILAMSDRLTVQAQVDETDVGQIKVGQVATIVLDAYPNDPVEGKVDKIAFEAKTVSNVTTYIATLVMDKIPRFMKSGMTANATFHILTKKDILVIPAEAVRFKGDKKMVFTDSGDPLHPSEKPIETGLTDGKKTEVVSGLNEGEDILSPKIATFLRAKTAAGSPVNPFGATSTPRPKRQGP